MVCEEVEYTYIVVVKACWEHGGRDGQWLSASAFSKSSARRSSSAEFCWLSSECPSRRVDAGVDGVKEGTAKGQEGMGMLASL